MGVVAFVLVAVIALIAMIPRAISDGQFTRVQVLVYEYSANDSAGSTFMMDYWSIWNPGRRAESIEEWRRKQRGANPGHQITEGLLEADAASWCSGSEFQDEYALIESLLASRRCDGLQVLETRRLDTGDGPSMHYELSCDSDPASFAVIPGTAESLARYPEWLTSREAHVNHGLPLLLRINHIPFGEWYSRGDPVAKMFSEYGRQQ
jgi:hypothetical protein